MKNRKILVLAIFLVCLLAVSAVSAEDNATSDVVSEGDTINLDDENMLAVEETADEPAEASADGDLIGDEELTADDWNYYLPNQYIYITDHDSAIIKLYWPENLTNQYVQIDHNGSMTPYYSDAPGLFPKDDIGTVTIYGDGGPVKRITLDDLGLAVQQSTAYTWGKYDMVVRYDDLIIGEFFLEVGDERNEVDYFTPAEYNVTLVNTVVDLYDWDEVIFTFNYPYKVINGSDGKPFYISQGGRIYTFVDDEKHLTDMETGNFRQVTLKELYIYDPGIHEIILVAQGVIKKFNLKVTKTYVADEFISFASWNVTEPDDPVCAITDQTMSGLDGTVTVFADGNKVFSKRMTAPRYEEIWIGLNNLTGDFYNGDYTIKVVYEKSNGETFSLEDVVSFVGISDMGNIPTTISASDMTVECGQNASLVATLKDNKGNPISGVDVMISIMGVSYPLQTDGNGQVMQSLINLPSGKHDVTFTFEDSRYVTSTKSVVVTVVNETGDMGNIPTTISASNKEVKYGQNANLVATLKDNNGNPISGVDVIIDIRSTSHPVQTDENGQAIQSLSSLPPGKHDVTFTFNDSRYVTSTKKVVVTVKKATPKIVAAKKTFKKSVKTKKYTITLKNSKNKVMKNAWVTLKVNKKTYKVKTNSKGKATFKITNLKKKGKFTAIVKYAGSKYYTAKTVKPKIIVK